MGLLDIFKRKKKEESPVSREESLALSKENESIQKFSQGLIDVKDIIAPSAIEVNFNNLVIGHKYFRSYFAVGFPSIVTPNWMEPLINFEYPVDISTFYYPNDTGEMLKMLKRKIAEMQATINLQLDSGQPADPILKEQLQTALSLQQQLAAGNEKFFQYSLYITIHANELDELESISRNLESTAATVGVILKVATLQQEECMQSTIPYGLDKIQMLRNLDTTAIATTFPFVSSELTQEKGVLYGINLHNNSLVIFDRFSLPNANSVVLATSGAGKSYAVKLEAVRSLMLGTEVIIIDPEKEFDRLCNAVGGEYISFSQDGAQKLNPFELSGIYNQDEDELRFKILTLTGLIRMMLGGSVTPEESAILDRALILTYKEKGITPDPSTHVKEPPLLEDLYKILNAMAEEEAHSMGRRLEKYLKGSAAGVFDRKSTVNLKSPFTVFSIRDLADDIRPMAMYIMLDFIWTRIKRDKKKRLLIIDEAWIMMQYPDAARFVYSIAKRARKYGLGLTTITQDVDDFLNSDFGKAIINNSSMQILLKQSPAAIDKLKKVFYLTEGEKTFLMSAGIGQGLFFAGANHVAIQVVASDNEHNLITTNPNEIFNQKISGPEGDQLDLNA
ncbi:MAG: ATP-binding protein [Rhodospirillales bacterium]|nr:ATP-binding protein [Rhodospirillales bacterium]